MTQRRETLSSGTEGYSNHWVKARKEIDGDKYVKNDESSGVTFITLNVNLPSSTQRPSSKDKPNFPLRFYQFLRHERVILIGENIKQIKRFENSFYKKTDGILYLSLDGKLVWTLSVRMSLVEVRQRNSDLRSRVVLMFGSTSLHSISFPTVSCGG